MADDTKPFACTEPSCGMSFSNEDHLSVHRMKHEMSLSLIPDKASFLSFADQTPTPTKFLKDCEGIGLFNEINKNPFEEAFKKATEGSLDGKTLAEGLHLAGSSDGTLNTPTPHVASMQSSVPPPKEPEYIPLPGPCEQLGSTISPNTPRRTVQASKASPITPDSTATTPTAHTSATNLPAHLASSAGLPFKLKLKREASLVENQHNFFTSSSPTEPKRANVSSIVVVSTKATSLAAAVPTSTAAIMAAAVAPTQAATIVVPAAQSAISRPIINLAMSSVNKTTTAAAASSSLPAISPLAVSSSSITGQAITATSSVPPKYLLQVMVQMPGGEMVPVNIPAQLSGNQTAATAAITNSVASRFAPTQATAATTTTPTSQIVLASPAFSNESRVNAASIAQVSMGTSAAVSSVSSTTGGAASLSTKQKLKAALQQNYSDRSSVPACSSPVICTSPAEYITMGSPSGALVNTMSPGVMQLSPSSATSFSMGSVELQDADTSTPKRPRSISGCSMSDDDPDDRRKKFLERNRAAAARCRQKKKQWIVNLEGKAEDLHKTNAKLQNEVTLLRAEVAQLKTLLLAHKDCPVTQQLQSSGLINIKPAKVAGGQEEVLILTDPNALSAAVQLHKRPHPKLQPYVRPATSQTTTIPIVMDTGDGSVELVAASTLTSMATAGGTLVTGLQGLAGVGTSILLPAGFNTIKEELPSPSSS